LKLPYLDAYCDARYKAAEYYNQGFSVSDKITTPVTSDFSTHVFHQYTLQVKDVDRNALHQHLLDNNIPNGIYYPVPLHLQKAYLDSRYKEENFSVTNELINIVISLPMHTELDNDQQDFIISTILNFIKQN
jgi:dTDP-4-amino-4,6-dideoxygalactose transaminase